LGMLCPEPAAAHGEGNAGRLRGTGNRGNRSRRAHLLPGEVDDQKRRSRRLAGHRRAESGRCRGRRRHPDHPLHRLFRHAEGRQPRVGEPGDAGAHQRAAGEGRPPIRGARRREAGPRGVLGRFRPADPAPARAAPTDRPAHRGAPRLPPDAPEQRAGI